MIKEEQPEGAGSGHKDSLSYSGPPLFFELLNHMNAGTPETADEGRYRGEVGVAGAPL